MQAGSRLLVDSGLAVKRIAREVGVDDELYFSRRFRASTGLSPSDYRETHRLDPARYEEILYLESGVVGDGTARDFPIL